MTNSVRRQIGLKAPVGGIVGGGGPQELSAAARKSSDMACEIIDRLQTTKEAHIAFPLDTVLYVEREDMTRRRQRREGI